MSAPTVDRPTLPATVDDCDALVEQIVDRFPALTPERKRALGALLGPAVTQKNEDLRR